MDDPFKAMDSTILATLGKPITIIFPDDSRVESQGIISREQMMVGQFDALAEDVTVLTLASDIQIKRGDQINTHDQQWSVDRKLKDDGYVAQWNLHET